MTSKQTMPWMYGGWQRFCHWTCDRNNDAHCGTDLMFLPHPISHL